MLVSLSNVLNQICSKMVTFLFSAYFGGHFCYHSNGKKVQSIPDLYTWAIVLINYKEETSEKQFSYFSRGAKIVS